MFTHTHFSFGKWKKKIISKKLCITFVSLSMARSCVKKKMCLLTLYFPHQMMFLNSPSLNTVTSFRSSTRPSVFICVTSSPLAKLLSFLVRYLMALCSYPFFFVRNFFFLFPFFFYFVHCVCLVDRVRVIVDKTSGINEIEKRNYKTLFILKSN
jgi:hypothetical protein